MDIDYIITEQERVIIDIMNSCNIKQCAWCRKVKNLDTGIWSQEIVKVILDVSHSICPDCKKNLWKEYRMFMSQRKN